MNDSVAEPTSSALRQLAILSVASPSTSDIQHITRPNSMHVCAAANSEEMAQSHLILCLWGRVWKYLR